MSPEPKEESTVQVLFVDDEENIVKSLRRLFMDEDFETLTATSGQQGLDLIKDNKNIGVVVSDQRMPGMSGVEFLEQARAVLPEAMRIVLTGYADIEAAMGAINRGGAFRYITKPWDDKLLLHHIREAVGLFSLKRDNQRMAAVIQKQNEELAQWNSRLQARVKEQTRELFEKNRELEGANKRLRKNFDNTIHAFSELLELRDESARRHAAKVGVLATRMATLLELPESEVTTVRAGAILHDIGKIGIRDEILRKDIAQFSEEERRIYQTHAVRGQAAIDSVEDLRPAGILIRHHHEAYNGQGFPDGLKADAIPMGARIIAMADSFDHQFNIGGPTDTVGHSLAFVKKLLGSLFDPALFPILQEAAVETYAGFQPETHMVEKEIEPKDLHENMTLAGDVTSGTGIFLIGKGTVLDKQKIEALKRYYKLDPPKEKIRIWAAAG